MLFFPHRGWISRNGYLMNSHNLWWKASKVYYRRETIHMLIWKTPPHVPQFPQVNKPSIPHSKGLFSENEEWIMTTSTEFTTCLAVIKRSALNLKINTETPSHVTISQVSQMRREEGESADKRSQLSIQNPNDICSQWLLMMWSPWKTKSRACSEMWYSLGSHG